MASRKARLKALGESNPQRPLMSVTLISVQHSNSTARMTRKRLRYCRKVIPISRLNNFEK